MREQPPEERSRNRRSWQNWEVSPAISDAGSKPLVYFRYGPIEHYLSYGAAKHIIEAMLNAMEHEETTTYIKPKGRIL